MFLLIRDMVQMGWFHQRPELPHSAALPRLKERIFYKAAGFEPLTRGGGGSAGSRTVTGAEVVG
jgi:hypothetical protein